MTTASTSFIRARHPLSLIAVAALLVSLASGLLTPGARAARGDDGPAFKQLAAQTITIDDDQEQAVWQATFLPTVDDETAMLPFAPGFLYAAGGTLLVYPEDGDQFSRLHEGEALTVDGARQVAPVAYGGRPTDFLALELTTADAANTPAGDPFNLPAGEWNLALWSLELPSDATDAVSLADATTDEGDPLEQDPDHPGLIITVGGSVEVTGDALADGPTTLTAGENDAVTVAGPVDIGLAGDGGDGATVLAVTIASKGDAHATGVAPSRGPARGGGTGGGGGSGSGGGTDGGHRSTASSPSPSPSPSPSASVSPSPSAKPSPSIDPATTDSDGDGLSDAVEAQIGTDPNKADTDGDGLPDLVEHANGLSPLAPDTDGDCVTDLRELNAGYNPLSQVTNPLQGPDGGVLGCG
jgi:hypothetical protein